MNNINVVTVVGANGTMGCNVSAIFASFGHAKVYMVSRSLEKSNKAMERAVKSVKADSIRKNLVAADYSMLEECIRNSDLVFESTAENMEIKQGVMKQIADCVKENTIISSGTSGLSLTSLAEMLPVHFRQNYVGIHFFNPPYNMPLCEVAPTKYTDVKMFQNIKTYLTEVLNRTTVDVKDSPAFLGNRIGFQFINEAMQYAEKYKYNGGIDYIDAILGAFTGRSMPPLVTSDFVGLDVHKAIVDNLYANTNDYANNTFCLPDFVEKLIQKNYLGKKTGCGLYKTVLHENGFKQHLVYDIMTGIYRDKINYTFPFVENMIKHLEVGEYERAFSILLENRSLEAEMCLEFLLKYVIYSLKATELVGYDIHSADCVMAAGFHWCPPLAFIEAFSGKESFKQLVEERISQKILNSVDIDDLLSIIEPSKYDFRKFMKAKK